jgi:hypothetical protein
VENTSSTEPLIVIVLDPNGAVLKIVIVPVMDETESFSTEGTMIDPED